MKSIMAVSMHKAGSSVANRILATLTRRRGYVLDQLAPKLSTTPLSEYAYFESQAPRIKTEDVYYGIARDRETLKFSMLPKLRVVMQIRDPRDCLTSAYFSFRDSHVPPEDPEKLKAFEERRERLNAITIDQYVINDSENYRLRMEALADLRESHPDLLLSRYERMVTETAAWQDDLAAFIGQPLNPRLRARLNEVGDFTVKAEDTTRHKRQVTPGDHARKLEPATITKLNDILGPSMRRLGYPV